MAALTETEVYESEIYQLEITDPVLGGPDGIDNLQAKQLGNRTAWLKKHVDEVFTKGIPTWNALQNYYVGSHAVGTDGKLYRSKTGVDGTPNVGNNPVGDTINWESASDMALAIHNSTAENPVDTDEFGYWDSFTQTLRKVTLENLKATLKTYFDTLYRPIGALLFSDMPAGSVIQVANYTTGEVAMGTTTTPYDDTIPQISEGTQFMSLAFTPKKANSKLRIDVVFNSSHNINGTQQIALHRDTTTNALRAIQQSDGASYPRSSVFTIFVDAIATTTTTFSVRSGLNSAGTITFNGIAGSRYLGGVFASSITITEIAQ